MPKKSSVRSASQRWLELVDVLGEHIPHVASWWSGVDDFEELRLKARPDGTTLAIAKGYDSSGGPVVCFGSGYGVEGALMALNASLQGGNWRVDKPWNDSGE